ncbi:MAG: hypothetical protein QNJ87_02140 [Gammaproteobacteria bacterium]|nr:hypothetical protein [Gammaproteobacteria bacterium]MDJ0889634.1 hypothetical protein [Gammaproteobacteria bacterium]
MSQVVTNGITTLQTEQGETAEVVVVAFTGHRGRLNQLPTFDFLQAGKVWQYNRIFVQDPFQMAYLNGISGDGSGYPGFLELLKEEIAQFSANQVIFLGSSGGGFGALLAGYLLDVDFVHAFNPYTYADFANIARYEDWDMSRNQATPLRKIQALPQSTRQYLDLRRLLRKPNGKTKYYVHVCHECPFDLQRAKHLQDCPAVSIIAYPCRAHAVGRYLARQKVLHVLLKNEHQPNLVEVLKEIFADKLLYFGDGAAQQ